jgi:hypothetical protein
LAEGLKAMPGSTIGNLMKTHLENKDNQGASGATNGASASTSH